jgi:hypothetical protein
LGFGVRVDDLNDVVHPMKADKKSAERFKDAIRRLHELMESEFADLTPTQKGWALEIAAIRYIPQRAPWLPPRDEVQFDHDRYVEEMSIGGPRYEPGTGES